MMNFGIDLMDVVQLQMVHIQYLIEFAANLS